MLGCCWHHAHEVEAATAESAETVEPAEHACCHGHHHDDAVEQNVAHAESHAAESHHDDSGHRCPAPCHEKCQVVSSGRVQLDESCTNFALDVSLSWSEPVTEPIASACQFAVDDDRVEPPLRLHLLHQLLLI